MGKEKKVMLKHSSIIKEIKDVPENRLEELYELVHSMTPSSAKDETVRKKILSYAGVLNDMSKKDYKDYLDNTKKTRVKLFSRNIDL